MTNTYAIYNDIEAAEQLLAECFDRETGEVSEDFDAADKLRQEVQSLGLETLCKARANRLALIANIKTEENRLKERRQRLEAQIASLEDGINTVYQHGDAPVQYAGNFTVSTRKSTQVITEPDFHDERFMRRKITEEVDKIALRKALENEPIAGASLKVNYNLVIK